MVTEISREDRKALITSINWLIKDHNFGDFLFDDRTKAGYRNWRDSYSNKAISEYQDAYDETIQFVRGQTKAVIIFEDLGFVVKFPFSNCHTNYCELEYANYRGASDIGLESCFAFCDVLGTFSAGNITVVGYVMEVADCDVTEVYSSIRDKYPKIIEEYEISELDDSIDEDAILEFLLEEWGNETYVRFYDFILDNKINDLHGANIGWAVDHWVLIDYSGFEG